MELSHHILSDYVTKSRIFALMFSLFSLYGLCTAINFGSANMDYYLVRNILSSWQQDGAHQNKQLYEKAKNAIILANQKQPSHPLYIELIGQIHEWGYMSGYEDEEALPVAKSFYLKAAKARPSWSVTWASLVMVKWQLQEFDDEMLQYISVADSLGPKKAEVNIMFAELGLALYTSNHPMYINIQKQVKYRILQGLLNPQSRQRIIASIQKNKAERTVCTWLKKDIPYATRKLLSCKLP